MQVRLRITPWLMFPIRLISDQISYPLDADAQAAHSQKSICFKNLIKPLTTGLIALWHENGNFAKLNTSITMQIYWNIWLK